MPERSPDNHCLNVREAISQRQPTFGQAFLDDVVKTSKLRCVEIIQVLTGFADHFHQLAICQAACERELS